MRRQIFRREQFVTLSASTVSVNVLRSVTNCHPVNESPAQNSKSEKIIKEKKEKEEQ